MLAINNNPTDIEIFINNAFKLYKKSITDTFLNQVKNEELLGESCVQYRNFDFYLALYTVVLVFKDVKKYPEQPWSYFITKYNLNALRRCLACNGIDLDLILEQFTLPSTSGEGVNFEEVEQTLEIEPEEIVEESEEENTTINILATLNSSGCTTNISSIC